MERPTARRHQRFSVYCRDAAEAEQLLARLRVKLANGKIVANGAADKHSIEGFLECWLEMPGVR